MGSKVNACVFGTILAAISSGSSRSLIRPVEEKSTLDHKMSVLLPDRRCQGTSATGQTECSDQAGSPIDCAGTGQDGDYQNGWTVEPYPRFTDSGDGTVKDNLTGLTWLKYASCFGTRFWTEALSDASTLASGSCGLTDGSVSGDWRLPNIRELQSLIDYSRFLPALTLGHPFSGVSNFYWSSSTHTLLSSAAFYVRVTNGFVEGVGKADSVLDVWPVRKTAIHGDSRTSESLRAVSSIPHVPASSSAEDSFSITLPDRRCQGIPATGQTGCSDHAGNPIDCAGTGQDGDYQAGWTVEPYPRFTDRGDGTVKDNLTSLIWLKDASCFGTRNWTDALSDANTLASGSCGLTDGSVSGDWRLPNIKELQSLLDYGEDFPALSAGHPFSRVNFLYWSSSPYSAFNPGAAWTLSLAGNVDNYSKTAGYVDVWPVRGGD